jgi:hypothetical protein
MNRTIAVSLLLLIIGLTSVADPTADLASGSDGESKEIYWLKRRFRATFTMACRRISDVTSAGFSQLVQPWHTSLRSGNASKNRQRVHPKVSSEETVLCIW